MNLCELYKDTQITVRATHTGHIYHGPIKTIYRVFHDIPIQVFYNGEWNSARIIGIPNERRIVKINNSLMCSFDLPLVKDDSIVIVKDLSGSTVDGNMISEKYISHFTDGKIKIDSIEITDIHSEWLFGVEFIDSKNKFYTLSNGFIISAK